jgi:hypothetical protein
MESEQLVLTLKCRRLSFGQSFGFFKPDARADIRRHDLIPGKPPTFPFETPSIAS